MDTSKLVTIVSLLITLSIASERLSEIVKGLIPLLNQENPDPDKEGWRRAAIQILAVASGIVTTIIARPIITEMFKGLFGNDTNLDLSFPSPAIFALGLLASGGSAFWNSILEYFLQIKDLREIKVERAKNQKKIEVAKAELEMEKVKIRKANLPLTSNRGNLPVDAGELLVE